MEPFFRRADGAVVSFAINKYIYVGVNKKFDDLIRLSYSETEISDGIWNLKHDIVRESLKYFEVFNGIEVVTMADIPGSGTGLGSSSTLTVGLIRALQKYTGKKRFFNPHELAEMAYKIEEYLCKKAVGKQDHFAAAYGGLHYYQFEKDKVIAELLDLNSKELKELQSRFTLLWTGRTRSATKILQRQERNLDKGRFQLASGMRDIAVMMRDDLRKKDISNIGAYMDANWQIKRRMANGISNDWIDDIYDRAIEAGAEGGKICGAGGGGFFLFYGKLGIGPDLEKATGLKQIDFKIEKEGSKVIYE
ncbi:MAG: kinase [Deltaproteobacteria bacterium]|nr:kinase [Deltaproteobacteria bacterium]